MTHSLCDDVAERVALGEPLGELAEHTATCARCQGLVAVSSQLSATRHAVDPGLGFTARMTVGAQHRIAARRRQRLAAGLAATVASGAFGVFLMTRSPDSPPTAAIAPPVNENQPAPDEQPTTPEDDELAALVELADVERSAHLSARWRHIKRPLAPYQKLISFEGETP
jgi:hypothetical protein